MNIIKSILVPTDFSATALNAFGYALQLADELDASIDLLYVVPPTTSQPLYGSFFDSYTATLQQEARSRLKAFISKGLAGYNDHLRHPPLVESFVMVGDLRTSIRKHTGREGSQLIVMGTAGRHDAWDDFLGTNASYLPRGRPGLPYPVFPTTVQWPRVPHYSSHDP